MQSGGLLKTHNFLQPLDGGDEKSDNLVDLNAKPPAAAATPASVVEHVLPGGIGTYSISHISYFNPRVSKPEENIVSDNSNCSSYTGSGFTLWDEPTVRKGNTYTEKENFGDVNVIRESTMKMGRWGLDRPSQSSAIHRCSISPLKSSQAVIQKSQTFLEMIESAKGPHSMEEEVEEDLSLKKETSSSLKGELRVNVGGKNSDKKAITPRSKHSATEQRRRCKINNRFQMLRELIPHSDQKRDKASFLLEVIGYIQYLQEKVNRYEGSYSGWNSEPSKLNPWRNSHGAVESFVDQSRVVNGITSPVLMLGAKLDEKATAVSLDVPPNAPNPEESSMTNAINVKTADQQPGITNNAGSNTPPLQHDIHAPTVSSCAITQPTLVVPSEAGNASFSQLQLWQSGASTSEQSVAADKLKDQELAVEGGTINISSIYSQGLLSTLTQALQSSGVDLSQASISVQVDIGKRARQNIQETAGKGAEGSSGNQSLLHARVDSTSSESDHAVKRLKTG